MFCLTPVETDGELVDTELGVVEPVLGTEQWLGGGEGENPRVPESEHRGHCGQQGENGAEEDADDFLKLNFSLT